MKIILISPGWTKEEQKQRKRSRVFKAPPQGLLNVAAVTPADITVELIDENIERVRFDKKPDLLGITVTTAGAPRAYEIADRYRKKGVPVVLGGPHVSYMTEEALEHCDSVVIGECEGAWEKLIDDFRSGGPGSIRRTYTSDCRADLSNTPLPRLDILKKDNYVVYNTLHITRGCPYNCSFCSVTNTFGRKIRSRPLDQVIEFVESNIGSSLKERFFLFLDDNIMADRPFAKKLFKALIPYKILWISQASINAAYDEELIELAAKSGCKGLFVGIETVSKKALREVGKSQNKVEFYKTAIERFHKYGIFLEGGFIFGFDTDSKDVFEKTVKFVNSVRLDGIQYSVLTPLPGTEHYAKIEKENRFTSRRWSDYDCAHVVAKPNNMSIEELRTGLHWAYKKTYSFLSILRRCSGVFRTPKRIQYFFFLLIFNFGHRFSCKRMFRTAWNPLKRTKKMVETLQALELFKKIEQLSHIEKAKVFQTLSQRKEIVCVRTYERIEQFSKLEGFAKFDALRKLRRQELKEINKVNVRFQRLLE